MSYEANKKKVLKDVDKLLEAKLAVIGEVIAGTAIANCPVGNYKDGTVGGRAKASISWRTNESSGGTRSHGRAKAADQISKPENLEVRIGSGVDYFKYIEFRTAVLRNALNENHSTIKQIL